MTEPRPADLDRLSQLTYRTNQFNFTTIRRSVLDVEQFLARGDAGGLVVRVADRFGDYGLVGVVLYEVSADRYRVDTCLLSCRVLGKGVEHATVAALAERARADGKALVEFRFAPSARNAPALGFLRSIESLRTATGPDSDSWIFPADVLARLEYTPADVAGWRGLVRVGNGRRGTRPRLECWTLLIAAAAPHHGPQPYR